VGREFESLRPDHLFEQKKLGMMKAKIYKPSKTSMQSGLGKTKKWVFEYQKQKDLIREPLMGWTGSRDTNEQVKLLFEDINQAINYAKKNNIEYEVIPEMKKKYSSKLYSDNFKFDRKDKWTH
tara:strand:+ start:122 stop:490 length:369 start_codon:yes stop_codon:yes gene_type:complete